MIRTRQTTVALVPVRFICARTRPTPRDRPVPIPSRLPVAALIWSLVCVDTALAGEHFGRDHRTVAPRVHSSHASAGARGPSTLSLRTQGNRFIDGNGNAIQLRGVNYSGFEFAAVQGWSGNDPSGGQAGQPGGPNWAALQAWKVNILRIPLNEASWLGGSCVDTSGNVINPDPAGNYRSAVQTQVEQANAAGLYVILDLHWTAPGNACPMLQTQMANADHSLAFWTSVASQFKNNPSVMFELFNEPFFNFEFSGDAWSYMMKGTQGSFSGFPATSRSGNWTTIKQPWAVASYQGMLDAVRATGATNVVLIGSMMYAQEFSGWLSHRPTDPLNQMAAVWHPYPTFGATWGSAAYAQPNYAPGVYNEVLDILGAGIPVIATETGDRNTAGTVGAPLVDTITRWADLNGISVLGWGWNVWSGPDYVLIKDADGTPSEGYGKAYHRWLIAH
ncbi:cellulase family glycosylhydrolase [Pseudomarimonas salicorniae]|uniref:Glycoside hydrolase family 5 protein n=1 Tax=Pseudomarimonas salicorniae TaxID=2933270 RepID=A0ABT0GEW1_9GAMM|nr:cellulase family glycosylhydrolase [Lysobacter sp. CAU 1642]MCK7593089.1 glycoside hydrolase family 5 protein [Lysobacter sp. CAU 1642]